LFGLLDDSGELKTALFENNSSRSKKKELMRAHELSKPREIDVELITQDDESFHFKPEKSKDALRAMRNPRLGYDFLDRLNSRGDFVARLNEEGMNGKKKVGKGQLEGLKADYAARLDKLACPNCRKEQSFDEFFESKRECSQCPGKPRFTKLNITSGVNFEHRLKQKEAKRLEKLAELESKVYPKPSTKVTTGEDFQKRMMENEAKKQAKLSKIANEVYGSSNSSNNNGNSSKPSDKR
jgi:hypothetical protein